MRLPENTFWLLIGIVVMMLLLIPILEFGGYYGWSIPTQHEESIPINTRN